MRRSPAKTRMEDRGSRIARAFRSSMFDLRFSASRGGATLTEVLMALLVMGLGLVSVATLFPLSLLRSVEATKLTNATLLRINAHARINASVWRDNAGNPIKRAIIEDPDQDGNVREHDATKFFYDPLGAATFASDGSPLATNVGWFDKNGNGQFDDFQADTPAGIERHWFDIGNHPAAQQLGAAEDAVTLPDSFVTLADSLVPKAPAAGVVRIPGVDLTEYAGTPGLQVTLIDANARVSEVRDIDGVSYDGANQESVLSLDSPMSPGISGDLGRAVVELPERRYTWIATVRRFGLKPSVTIAVFFRRAFDPEDERVYLVDEPAGGYNEFELSGVTLETRPAGMKVGGYMFDVATFRWLKIASLEQITITTPTGTAPGVRFTTDPEDIDPSPRPRAGFPAMFPNNVVEAYTLKKN